MLSRQERRNIRRACCEADGGINGLILDHDHLEFMHLCFPFRDIRSFMAKEQITRFPICFLDSEPRCDCVKHGRPELLKAIGKLKSGIRDRHRWLDSAGLEEQFGIATLADKLCPGIVHDVCKQKLNNFRAILDPTSATKHYFLSHMDSPQHIDVLLFVLSTTIFLNEGHYIWTFMHLYSKVRRGSQFSLTKLQESAEASASLKAELLGLFAAGTLPAMIRCDEYDVSAAHEAMKMCVFLYGRQPHAGYRQGAGREVDVDPCLDGAGTRIHRFVVRLGRLCDLLLAQKDFLNRGPLPALQVLPGLLQTTASWMPYQAQLVLRRYLSARYYNTQSKMCWPAAAITRLAGPGTIFWFRRLAPQGFAFLNTACAPERDADDELPSGDERPGEGNRTVVSTRLGKRSFSCGVVDALLVHQKHMLLHKRVGELLEQADYDWHDIQYAICELRGFVYTWHPRRTAGGFLKEARAANWKWHLEVALPFAWRLTESRGGSPDAPAAKHRRTK